MELLDELPALNAKKRTYAKVHERLDAEDDVGRPSDKPSIFSNSILDQVKRRLEGSKEEEKQRGTSGDEFHETDLNIYDGENLEQEPFPSSSQTMNCSTKKSDNVSEGNLGTKHEKPSNFDENSHKSAANFNTSDESQVIHTTQPSSMGEPIRGNYHNGSVKTSKIMQDPFEYSQTQVISSAEARTHEISETQIVADVTPNESFTITDAQRNETQHLSDYSTNEDEDFLQPTHPDSIQDSYRTEKFNFLEPEVQKLKEKKVKQITKPLERSENTTAIRKNFSKEAFLKFLDSSDESEDDNVNNNTRLDSHEQDHKDLGNEAKQGSLKVSLAINMAEKESERQVELSSNSEDESIHEIRRQSAFTKAALLDIKARHSKNRVHKRKHISKKTSQPLKELFNSLREANKKQILNSRKELSEKRGITLDELEKEREIVENLLEQEIQRNKKVRELEKERERELKLSKGLGTEKVSDDVQENSDVPESDASSEYLSSDIEQEDQASAGPTDSLISESDDPDSNLDDGSDGSENRLVTTRRERQRAAPGLIDDEGEEEETSPMNIPLNSINLGSYGNNLDMEVNHRDIEGLSPRIKKVEDLSLTQPQAGANKDIYAQDSGVPSLSKIDASAKASDSTNGEDPENELQRRQLIRRLLLERKRQEKKERARRKEMKHLKVNKMFELEAEESEDEWHGVGGADGDDSGDDDSELEQMIDDYTAADFDPHAIRKQLASENRELDEQMVNKILHDLKTGGFRKRGAGALDLELSDKEDDILLDFRAKRREQQRRKLLEEGNSNDLNPRTNPFFESMIEDTAYPNIIGISEKSSELGAEQPPSEKKNVVITEQFVKETLSFLSSDRSPGGSRQNTISQEEQIEDETPDLFKLKQNSRIKALNNPRRANIDLLDEGTSNLPGFGLPSVVKSFSMDPEIGNRFKNGFKSVKISRAQKTMGGSRAAITFMANKRKLVASRHSNADRSTFGGGSKSKSK